MVSGPCAVLTITHSQDLPKPAVEKASRRKKQLGSCFLFRQSYFSLQLCLTKTSLCRRHPPKKGLIHPALDSESAAASSPGLWEARAWSPGSCRTSSVGWRLGPAPRLLARSRSSNKARAERPRLSCAPERQPAPCALPGPQRPAWGQRTACARRARTAVKFGS